MRDSLSLRERLIRALALRVRRHGQARRRSGVERVLRAARATMARKKYCLLATLGEQGIDARVLQPFAPADDFEVWLGTSPRSRKVAQLRADARATLVYQDDGRQTCVVFAGRVEIVEDLAERRRRFHPTWWAFYPNGPAGDDFVLLRVVPHRLEVWDARRGIALEPFGLRSAQLVRSDGVWSEA